MSHLFDKVSIVGVGLIGGSLGLELRERGLCRTVVGVGHRQESIDRALAIGAIDEGALDPVAGVKDADLVILATAIGLIVKIGRQVAPHLKTGCVVSDVGSTKAQIVREMEQALPAGVHFVGAHPIAGSEKRGVDAAHLGLFAHAVCVLTPTRKTDPDAARRVTDLWSAVGAKVTMLSCEEHDATLARTSHLPHLAAAALVATLRSSDAMFAGSGFRDTTRVASGDVDIWCDILLTNRQAAVDAVDSFGERLGELRRAIESGDRAKLAAFLSSARNRRDSLSGE